MLDDFFSGKKVLVTGHSGFKGSWLSEMLLLMGSDVAGYSLSPNTDPNLFSILGLEKKVKNHFADIRDYKKVLGVMKEERPEIVIHMAAQPLVRDSYDDPVYTYETNLIGTVNALQAMKEAGCAKAAVMITTDKVYENKESGTPFKEDDKLGGYDPYSASKACAEIAIGSYINSFFNPEKFGISHNTLIASARAGNVMGGGDWSKDRLVPDMMRAFYEKKETLLVRNPDAVRPWQHVLDPLYGYLLLAKKLHEGKKDFVGAWNFAPETSNCISVEELVKKAVKDIGGDYAVKADAGKHEMKTLRLDAAKAKKRLAWKPTFGMDQCLERTFGWYKNFYGRKQGMKDYTDQQIREYMDGR
jgi:CDP-glucose 4,6-dehydratase